MQSRRRRWTHFRCIHLSFVGPRWTAHPASSLKGQGLGRVVGRINTDVITSSPPLSPAPPHNVAAREKGKRDSLVGTSGVWCSHPLRDRLVYVYYGRTCRCKAVPVRRALGSLAARVTAQDANKRAHRTAIAHILIQTAIPHTGILCAARLDHRRSTFPLLCHRPQRVTGPLIVEFTHSSPLSRQYACPFVSCSSLKIFFIRSL